MNIGLVKEAGKDSFWENWLKSQTGRTIAIYESRPLRNYQMPDLTGFANFIHHSDLVVVDTGALHLRIAEILIKNLKHTLVSLPESISANDIRRHLQLTGETRSIVWYCHPYELTPEAANLFGQFEPSQYVEINRDIPFQDEDGLRKSITRDLSILHQLVTWPVKKINVENLATYDNSPGFVQSRFDYINGTHAGYKLNLVKQAERLQSRIFANEQYAELSIDKNNICSISLHHLRLNTLKELQVSLFAQPAEVATEAFRKITNMTGQLNDFNNCEQKIAPYKLANDIISKFLLFR